jgi:hypothetical protein
VGCNGKSSPKGSSSIGGYHGAEYIIIGNELVIVDQNALRIVAIVPDIR